MSPPVISTIPNIAACVPYIVHLYMRAKRFLNLLQSKFINFFLNSKEFAIAFGESLMKVDKIGAINLEKLYNGCTIVDTTDLNGQKSMDFDQTIYF